MRHQHCDRDIASLTADVANEPGAVDGIGRQETALLQRTEIEGLAIDDERIALLFKGKCLKSILSIYSFWAI